MSTGLLLVANAVPEFYQALCLWFLPLFMPQLGAKHSCYTASSLPWSLPERQFPSYCNLALDLSMVITHWICRMLAESWLNHNRYDFVMLGFCSLVWHIWWLEVSPSRAGTTVHSYDFWSHSWCFFPLVYHQIAGF